MSTLIYCFENQYFDIVNKIQKQTNIKLGNFTLRQFPDGETYLKLSDNIANKNIILFFSLNNPNNKIADLLFFAQTCKQQGANHVGLVAPYLCYMRQDQQFNPGEAVTSKFFAKFISDNFDWLITVDPHLHRYKSMHEIYSIPSKIVPAATKIACWIKDNLANPILIGPDQESEQWVKKIADLAKIEYTILTKQRLSDTIVKISIPNPQLLSNKQPVIVDDIISTGNTLLKTIEHLKTLNTMPPICIGVHAIFANDAYDKLIQAGAVKIITCNTIKHQSNLIDLSDLLADAVSQVT